MHPGASPCGEGIRLRKNAEDFWRDYISTPRVVGYDDVLSVEHEDPLIEPEEGFELAVELLQRVMPRKTPTALWFE